MGFGLLPGRYDRPLQIKRATAGQPKHAVAAAIGQLESKGKAVDVLRLEPSSCYQTSCRIQGVEQLLNPYLKVSVQACVFQPPAIRDGGREVRQRRSIIEATLTAWSLASCKLRHKPQALSQELPFRPQTLKPFVASTLLYTVFRAFNYRDS